MNRNSKQMKKKEDSFTIVIARKANITINFAAIELQKYLFKITNMIVNIRKSIDILDRKLIIIGTLSDSQIKKLSEEVNFSYNDLGEDGFLIKTIKNNLIIAGENERGSLYGVYTFLERFWGVRWFYPDTEEEIVPKKNISYLEAIVENGVNILEKPNFKFRERTFLEGQNFYTIYPYDIKMLPKWIDWMAKNKMNCVFFHFRETQQFHQRETKKIFSAIKKRSLKIGVGDCAYRYFLSPSKYSKDHPEWFPMLNEKNTYRKTPTHISHPKFSNSGLDSEELAQPNFCTSNIEAVRTFINNVSDYVKQNPEIDFLLVRPNDGGEWCECTKCRQLPIPDRYLKVDNMLAGALYKINPNIKIQHNPYATYIGPPKYEVPTQNIEIVYEAWGRNYSYSFNCSRYNRRNRQRKGGLIQNLPEELQLFLLKWLAICAENNKNKVYLHEKYVRQRLLGPHLLPLRIFSSDLQYFKKIGVGGLHLCVEMGGWWVKGLSLYTLAKLLWNAETNVQSLLDDYFEKYYGDAKTSMKKFYMLTEKALPGLQYANANENFNLCSDWSEQSSRCYPQGLKQYNENALKILDKCEKYIELAKKQTNNKQILHRIGKARNCFRYIKNQRVLIQYQIIAIDFLKEALDSKLEDSLKNIQKAASFFKKAIKLKEENKNLISAHFDEGIFWDVGTERKKWRFAW